MNLISTVDTGPLYTHSKQGELNGLYTHNKHVNRGELNAIISTVHTVNRVNLAHYIHTVNMVNLDVLYTHTG